MNELDRMTLTADGFYREDLEDGKECWKRRVETTSIVGVLKEGGDYHVAVVLTGGSYAGDACTFQSEDLDRALRLGRMSLRMWSCVLALDTLAQQRGPPPNAN